MPFYVPYNAPRVYIFIHGICMLYDADDDHRRLDFEYSHNAPILILIFVQPLNSIINLNGTEQMTFIYHVIVIVNVHRTFIRSPNGYVRTHF